MPLKPPSFARVKHKSTLTPDPLPPPKKKLKAEKGVSILSLSPCLPPSPSKQPSSAPKRRKTVTVVAKDAKGKGKATNDDAHEESIDGRLWVDKYEPHSLQDLAVHKRKVDDVRKWLVEAFDEKGRSKHRRLLVLTGPAGSAKTTTLRVLAREMDFDIVEYKENMNTTRFSTFSDEPSTSDTPDAFSTFLMRTGAYTSVFTFTRRKLVLVEDLPNILHPAVRSRFHDALRAHVECARDVAPLVLVISDAGVSVEGGSNGGRGRDLVIDVRTIVPPGLSSTSPFTEIRFNPIASTLLASAVKRVTVLAKVRPSPNTLHSILEGAGGDVRNAIMTLEFTCAHLKSRKQSGKNTAGSIVSVTQKENALMLFHLMGKIMYNKRKGDPDARSASAKDIARDRALDRSLEDPPPLPPWLAAEERRTSRVDVDMLYASTPIDASLFGLYIHQNYTQFCSGFEQCSSLIENLSWADSNGSENWYDANPHTFHVLALGALHSLPSPVLRTGQLIRKPEFFGALQREHGARDALERTSSWLSNTGLLSRVAITTELGGMLRAMGRHAPHGHGAFSELVFGQDSVGAEVINEGDCEGGDVGHEEGERSQSHMIHEQAVGCGYLEDDDIEDW
ncbi:Rad17-domain-containing protein [Russula ochroleuca]|uniref:Rad17-domain-containing protein n=1 Tax=Russula ochroleuca TaxID=152965 RepID=A0A9P5N0F8_9AGAM|nr:Rad17-domain-containing protein [Russula ochroleuca]